MNSFEAVGFSTDTYLEAQLGAFKSRIVEGSPHVIEFGGKPFGDHHAARVLPGYDADVKAAILQGLQSELQQPVMALTVHAQDILRQPDGRRINRRIRGDSGLTYDDEVIRLAEEGRSRFDLALSDAVITAIPTDLSAENEDYLGNYTEELRQSFDRVHQLPFIEGYPHFMDNIIVDALTTQPSITTPEQNLIVLSPGGGSGKFGVAVSELAHKFYAGKAPNFIKFETFPVFGLAPEHPLNLAFIAATADLGNRLMTMANGDTNYDKDVENLAILKALREHFLDTTTPLHGFEQPTDMGVNVIEKAITDERIVITACTAEIRRRIQRYEGEIAKKFESQETLDRTTDLLSQLTA